MLEQLEELTACVDKLRADGSGFSPACAVAVFELKEAVVRLETAVAAEAEASGFGDEVGSTDVAQFYVEKVGVSKTSAKKLLERARYPWTIGVSSETQDLILSWLKKLDDAPSVQREIFDEATALAMENNPDQMRKFLSKRVREARAKLDRNLETSESGRYCRLSAQDSNGMATLNAKLPGHSVALLKSLLDSAFKQGAGRGSGVSSSEDQRTFSQRHADALSYVIGQASSTQISKTGHASLLISMLDSDFDNLNLHTRFQTNTGFDLSVLDVARLGDGLEDFFLLHGADGKFLKMTTARRCATFYQKVALLALDLVCQHPGCDRPHSECDVHHIVAYLMGGEASLENLTLLCRKHHRHNDDTRTKPNRGYVDKRGPDTVRVFRGEEAPNDSHAARQSARYRIRHRVHRRAG